MAQSSASESIGDALRCNRVLVVTGSPTSAQPGPYGFRKKFDTGWPANGATRLALRMRSANVGARVRSLQELPSKSFSVCLEFRIRPAPTVSVSPSMRRRGRESAMGSRI